MIERAAFPRGWVPDADPINGPVDALLRADNCLLDELGVVSLRQGSAKINSTPFADTDVNSLYTAILGGTRFRMAGTGSHVYANGSDIASGIDGSGEIAFASFLGQIFFTRGGSKHKYDGSTSRTWGISKPIAAPTVAVLASDSKTFVSGDSGESPGLTWDEDDGTGASYGDGFDGTTNGAAIVQPDTSTGRGTVTKTFGSPQDFTLYNAGGAGTDDDLIDFYLYITEPQYLAGIFLSIDVNDGTFSQDVYYHMFQAAEPGTVTPQGSDLLAGDYTSEGDQRLALLAAQERAGANNGGQISPTALPTKGTATTTNGWNHFQIRRGDMDRTAGLTAGKDWSTVKAVRIDIIETTGGAGAAVRLDALKIIGGSNRPLTGTAKHRFIAVRSDGVYVAKSPASDPSDETQFKAQGAAVTIASGTISALDSQATEIWVFRMGNNLDAWYRTAVLTGGPWSGTQVIDDITSDRDALIADIRLETFNDPPPDSIIGIAGPHFDRLFCLTSSLLWPSQPLDPDAFDARQPVAVGDSSETAYWVAKVDENLYVGTSKDVYRMEGDWTELADGTLNVRKNPMGVGSPPISKAFAQYGQTLIYLAADGWRPLASANALTATDVSLLYRGYTRHGVSPVNVEGGRFVAAITKGLFTAITPEGSDDVSSSVLHRYSAALTRWYRHTYSPNWRSLYREPDGTLIAGDDAGYTWVLDTGSDDDGAGIPVVLWTRADDGDQPVSPKLGCDVRARVDTGGATASLGVYLDGSATAAAATFTGSSAGAGWAQRQLVDLDPFYQMQVRLTGAFNTFKWYAYVGTFTALPKPSRGYDSGPLDLAGRAVWITQLEIKAKLTAPLTVQVDVDGAAGLPQTVQAPSADPFTTFTVPMPRVTRGRQPRVILSSPADFYLFWVEVKYRPTGSATDCQTRRIGASA